MSLRPIGVVRLDRLTDDDIGERHAAHALTALDRFPAGTSVKILVSGQLAALQSGRNLAVILRHDGRLQLQLEGDPEALQSWLRRLSEVGA